MSFKLRAILALFAERSLNLVTKKIHLEALTNLCAVMVEPAKKSHIQPRQPDGTRYVVVQQGSLMSACGYCHSLDTQIRGKINQR
jgi:hypothetical protein